MVFHLGTNQNVCLLIYTSDDQQLCGIMLKLLHAFWVTTSLGQVLSIARRNYPSSSCVPLIDDLLSINLK
jgi:hypothetical protein